MEGPGRLQAVRKAQAAEASMALDAARRTHGEGLLPHKARCRSDGYLAHPNATTATGRPHRAAIGRVLLLPPPASSMYPQVWGPFFAFHAKESPVKAYRSLRTEALERASATWPLRRSAR